MMVVSSNDGSTTLWDLRSRTQIGGSFPERPSIFTAPVFEPNGKLLIQYHSDAAQWPTDVGSWERFACQVAGRNLTPAEWHVILPARPLCMFAADQDVAPPFTAGPGHPYMRTTPPRSLGL